MVGETVDGEAFAFKIRQNSSRVVQRTSSQSTHPEDPEKMKYFNKLTRKMK